MTQHMDCLMAGLQLEMNAANEHVVLVPSERVRRWTCTDRERGVWTHWMLDGRTTAGEESRTRSLNICEARVICVPVLASDNWVVGLVHPRLEQREQGDVVHLDSKVLFTTTRQRSALDQLVRNLKDGICTFAAALGTQVVPNACIPGRNEWIQIAEMSGPLVGTILWAVCHGLQITELDAHDTARIHASYMRLIIEYTEFRQCGAVVGEKRRRDDIDKASAKRRRVNAPTQVELAFHLNELAPKDEDNGVSECCAGTVEEKGRTGAEMETDTAAQELLQCIGSSQIVSDWVRHMKHPFTLEEEVRDLWVVVRSLVHENARLRNRLLKMEGLVEQIPHMLDTVTGIEGRHATREEECEVEVWWPGKDKALLLQRNEPQCPGDEEVVRLNAENIGGYVPCTESEGVPAWFVHDFPHDLPTSWEDYDEEEAVKRVKFAYEQIGIVAKDHTNWTRSEMETWCPEPVFGGCVAIDRAIFIVELDAALVFKQESGTEASRDHDWRWMTVVPTMFDSATRKYRFRLLSCPSKDVPAKALDAAAWGKARRMSFPEPI